ncbi:MAG: TylF/MycF/NovP-related O-methyltransferase [Acidimicrobiales bacterium]
MRNPFRVFDVGPDMVGLVARFGRDADVNEVIATSGVPAGAVSELHGWLDELAIAGIIATCEEGSGVDELIAVRHGEFEVRRATTLIPDLEALEPDFMRSWESVRPLTLTTAPMGYALWNACVYVVRAQIPGSIVECGVWRGGSILLAWRALTHAGDWLRTLYLYDTFEWSWEEASPCDGFVLAGSDEDSGPERVAGDTRLADVLVDVADTTLITIANEVGTCLESVRDSLIAAGCDHRRLVFVKGLVQKTLREVVPDEISVLRLDTDRYESTLAELTTLYPRLAPGGVLILDDYGKLAGATRAADEYFSRLERVPLLQRVESQGRIAVKPI